MSIDEVAGRHPEGYEDAADNQRTSSEQPRTTSEQAANNSDPSPTIAYQGETGAIPEQNQREAAAIQRAVRTRTARKQAETERKPLNLLQYARKHAPREGDERETRCAWIVRDDDAPAGEWWICKRCEVVLDSSAKVGAHTCRPKRAPRRAAARSAQQTGARTRWRFWS